MTMTTKTTYWTSADHQARFLEAVPRIGKTWPEMGGQFDTEYAAALYILTSRPRLWKSVEEYVDRDGIDFDTLISEVDLSGGPYRLVRLAWHLFNEGAGILPIDLLYLDEENFRLALEAITMRKYGFRPHEKGE